MVREIEELAPKADAGPNPEYPWETGGRVFCPLEHNFPSLRLETPKMVKALNLFDQCFKAIAREIQPFA